MDLAAYIAAKVDSRATLRCAFCPEVFTRDLDLRSHQKIHEAGPFTCFHCGTSFASQYDCKRHEALHFGAMKYTCNGVLMNGFSWGCGKTFSTGSGLLRHFRCEDGKACLQPVHQQELAHVQKNPDADFYKGNSAPSDPSGLHQFPLPHAIYLQFPTLKDLDAGRLPTESSTSSMADPPLFPMSGIAGDASYSACPDSPLGKPCATKAHSSFRVAHSPADPAKESISHRFSSEESPTTVSPRYLHPHSKGLKWKPPVPGQTKKRKTFGSKRDVTNYPAVYETEERRSISSATSLYDSEDWSCKEEEREELRGNGTWDSMDTEEAAPKPLASMSYSADKQQPSRSQKGSRKIPILDPDMVVNMLMAEFRRWHSKGTDVKTRPGGSNSFRSDPSGYSSSKASDPALTLEPSTWRKSGDGGSEDPNSPGDGSSDGNPHKYLQGSFPTPPRPNRKFACPFYQRNPQGNQRYRSCGGPGWHTVHRVKEHVYRRHAQPIQCPRCFTTFKSEADLSEHHRQTEICPVRIAEPVDGFDKEQEKKLKSRKRTSLSEEGKWMEMYKILFPNDEEWMTPSPYYEQPISAAEPVQAQFAGLHLNQFQDYLSSELPRRVRQRLEERIPQTASRLETQLRNQLIQVVQQVQSELFESYQSPSNQSMAMSTPSSQVDTADTETSVDITPNPCPCPHGGPFPNEFSAWNAFVPPQPSPNLTTPEFHPVSYTHSIFSPSNFAVPNSGYDMRSYVDPSLQATGQYRSGVRYQNYNDAARHAHSSFQDQMQRGEMANEQEASSRNLDGRAPGERHYPQVRGHEHTVWMDQHLENLGGHDKYLGGTEGHS